MIRRSVLLTLAVFSMFIALGCSIGQMIVRPDTPTPAPTRTPRPTFTPAPPSPTATDTPAPTSTPTPTVPATPTPFPTDTPMPLPTDTPVPILPATATPTPPPLGVTTTDNLNYRAGPGTTYGSLGKLSSGVTLEVRSRLADSSWLRVCCLQGQEGWVAAQFIQLNIALESVPVDETMPPTATRVAPPPARPATATPAPPTPAFRFRFSHKEEFPTNNDFLDIGVLITTGQKDNFLAGFRIKVIDTTNGKEYLSKPSTSTFYWTDMEGSGAAKKANVNFDRIPMTGPTTWIIYVTDESGNRLSEDVSFSARPSHLKYYFVFIGN